MPDTPDRTDLHATDPRAIHPSETNDATDVGGDDGTWPATPPEVPPPHRPDLPPEPEPTRTPFPIPLVVPAERDRPGVPDLFTHRIVLLLGALDDAAAARLAAEIMTLDADGDDQITFHLACQDGEVLAALMLAETIEVAVSRVVMIAKGVVGGVALAPFAAASRRVASPHATFRLTEPRLSVEGVTSELRTEAEAALHHLARFRRLLATATGRSEDAIAEDMRRGRTFDAPAALEYGLLDEITPGRDR